MARFYASFIVGQPAVTALEANVAGKRHLKVAVTGDPVVLRQALLDQRAALDAHVRPQITAANNNGALGTVVPRDAMTRGGTNTTTGLYTHPQAVYNADPAVRPNVDIVVANSTPVAPANNLTITNTILDAARTAVNNAVTGAGVYSRLGTDGAKTLRSLYAPADASYLAWDTFTPDDPGPTAKLLATDPPSNPVGGSTLGIIFQWFINHPTDIAEAVSDWTINVAAISTIGSPGATGVSTLSASGTAAIGISQATAYTGAQGMQGGFRYRATCTVRLKYASTSVLGPLRTYILDFDLP